MQQSNKKSYLTCQGCGCEMTLRESTGEGLCYTCRRTRKDKAGERELSNPTRCQYCLGRLIGGWCRNCND